MLKTKRWWPQKFLHPAGELITFEGRRMPYGESVQFLAETQAAADMLSELIVEPGADGEASKARLVPPNGEDTGAWNLRYYSKLPSAERVTEILTRNVRNVEGLEEDGVAITTGAQLAEVADHILIGHIMIALRRLVMLTVDEGKDSGSPSTSSPEGTTSAGV